MALNVHFKTCLARLMRIEGGYNNDPADPGAETFRGISRRFHPSWPGWSIIDLAKIHPDFPATLKDDAELARLVVDFYHVNYWQRFQGDQVAAVSHSLACELMESSVILGVHKAAGILQRSLNYLNRNGALYPDVVVDGVTGPATLAALASFAAVDSIDLLVKVLNILQGAHFLAVIDQNPTQEKFARGWLARVAVYGGP